MCFLRSASLDLEEDIALGEKPLRIVHDFEHNLSNLHIKLHNTTYLDCNQTYDTPFQSERMLFTKVATGEEALGPLSHTSW